MHTNEANTPKVKLYIYSEVYIYIGRSKIRGLEKTRIKKYKV